MIITITMNPAIDKTIHIDSLKRGELNRIKNLLQDAGGKGINVSKNIKKMGSDSISVGIAGGNSGRTVLQILDREHIRHDFVWISQETRINTKICEDGGITTELNEPGPVISEEDISRFMEKLSAYTGEGHLFVLSGSVPTGVPADFYGKVIRFAHKHGIPVLLDADGELLKNGLKEIPDMVKPNRAELIQYAGLKDDASIEEIVKAGKEIQAMGVKTVAITLGAQGAVLLKNGKCIFSPSLKVRTGSTVGAGDAFVAGLAYAWEKNYTEEDTMRLCMAAASGAVTTAGTKAAPGEIIEDLGKKVILEYL